jgi:hypothetical protein
MSSRVRVASGALGVLLGGQASAQWTDDAALNTPVVTETLDHDEIKLGVTSDGTMLQSPDAVNRASIPSSGVSSRVVSRHTRPARFVAAWRMRCTSPFELSPVSRPH